MENPKDIKPSYEGKWGALLAIGIGMSMSALDMSVVTIILPTLLLELNAEFAPVQWVMISYNLIITSAMMGAARLGDMYDKKKLNCLGLLLFTIGSLLCGLSPNVGWLIAFRILQGLGAVIMQALSMAIIVDSVPPQEKGRTMGILGGMSSVAFAFGPAIGGVILGSIGWRWIFFFNIPFGILAIWASLKYIPFVPPRQVNEKFDIWGANILFVALGCFALGMTLGQDHGFAGKTVQSLLLISLIGIVCFIVVQKKIKFPMVDLSLFNNLTFNINLIMGFVAFVTLSGYFLIPFFLQFVRQYTPKEIGFIMMLTPVCVGILSLISGSLSDRFGTQGISIIGIIIMAIGCFCVNTLTPETGVVGFMLKFVPIAIGLGTFNIPNNSAIMGAAPPERLGVASGLLSLTRSLAQTAGMPIMGTIFTATLMAITKLETLPDISEVDHYALVRGIGMTYFTGGVSIIVLVAGAIILLKINVKTEGSST